MMENQEPSIKKQKVEEESANHINKLPNWVIGVIVRKLSLTERLRCERVDCKWKESVREYGWTEQKKLDYRVVFEGAERVREEEFTNESLVALFKRIGKNLVELSVWSFFTRGLPISPYICGSLPFLTNLVKIDMRTLELVETVPFLPNSTLREIHTNGPFTEGALSALAKKCPKLEAIWFQDNNSGNKIAVSHVNAFLLKYPGLEALLLDCSFMEGSETLTSIGALKELEELVIDNDHLNNTASHFDEKAFEAMIEGCKRLRRLEILAKIPISEESFCLLGKLPNLVELVLPQDHPNVTDTVVKAISKRCQNLKKLNIGCCHKVTDDSVVYSLEHCKFLVSLHVYECPLITEKSLDAVIAEVKKRHGDPPKTLPEGPFDSGIFYFPCVNTEIDWEEAFNMNADNPWLELDITDLCARSFL